MDLDGFETRLLTADVAACRRFYEGLGFQAVVGPDDVVRLVRGDCRLALAPSSKVGMEAWFREGDAKALGRDVAAESKGHMLRLVDPDGMGLAVGDGFPPTVATAPFDPVLGWYELSLDVANIARTAGFYGRLGFEAAGGDIAQRHLTLQQGDCQICLYQGYLDPPGTQLIFWQGDVAAVAALAEREGLKVHRGLLGNDEGHLSLMLEDPDGRGLFFIFIPGVERLEPTADD